MQSVFKVAIWILYLEAENFILFFIIFGASLTFCNKIVFGVGLSLKGGTGNREYWGITENMFFLSIKFLYVVML